MKLDLKTWLFFNIVCDTIMVFMIHYAFRANTTDGAQFIYSLNLCFSLGIALITFLMFLMMDLDLKSHQKELVRSGEAEPYFRKDYDIGRVVAFGKTVKIYHGTGRIRMDVNEFIKLADQIKWKYNNTLVQNPNDTAKTHEDTAKNTA